MKASDYSFINPSLNSQCEVFLKKAELRFKFLDRFNADCKTLTQLLEKHLVPNIEFVGVSDGVIYSSREAAIEAAMGQWCIGWCENFIVYCDAQSDKSLLESKSLLSAPAAVRSFAAEHNLLEKLFEKAIKAMEAGQPNVDDELALCEEKIIRHVVVRFCCANDWHTSYGEVMKLMPKSFRNPYHLKCLLTSIADKCLGLNLPILTAVITKDSFPSQGFFNYAREHGRTGTDREIWEKEVAALDSSKPHLVEVFCP